MKITSYVHMILLLNGVGAWLRLALGWMIAYRDKFEASTGV
jgi:hypothetical protein